jgi:uncharacterized protein YqeY
LERGTKRFLRKEKGEIMSEILKEIKSNLKTYMLMEMKLRKEGIIADDQFSMAVAQKTVARAIISMFPEIGKKPKDATDDDVIKLLKRYINNEKERLLYSYRYIVDEDVQGITYKELKKIVDLKIQELGDKLTSPKIAMAQRYLPKQATEEDIILWIKENIDFSNYKNKMQAMGPIMKQFKGADGNFVKGILLKL